MGYEGYASAAAAGVLETIRNRRSVRRFTDAPVPDGLILEMLTAACSAPSACNEQPWHFVVVAERSTLVELARRHPYGGPVQEAPLCVVVCADMRLAALTLQAGDFWAQGLAAATQNLLLAAAALGLGAVWIGTYPDLARVEAVRDVIGAPGHIVPFALVPIGYPRESPGPHGAADPTRIHRERW